MSTSVDTTIIHHKVEQVHFGFYTDDEIRQLSVKEITARITFDSMRNPVSGGLYDPALGPIDFNMICPTCHQTQRECPGHLGHIELPVPVYNPLLFPIMLKILKRKCFSCHKLRIASSVSRITRVKILLYDNGFAEEADKLSELLEQRDGLEEEPPNRTFQRQQAILDEYERLALSGRAGIWKNPKTARCVQVSRERLIAELLKSVKQKCNNCGAISPEIRQDSNTKIFVKTLSDRARRYNRLKNLKSLPAVDQIVHSDIEQDNSDSKQVSDECSSSSDDSCEDIVSAALTNAKDTAASSHKFMPPVEVQSQLQLLWKHEDGLMDLCFGDVRSKNNRAIDAVQGWRKFFLHVIPVAPARFRPPVFLGENQFEHAQNTHLSKILQIGNLILQNTHKNNTLGPEDENFPKQVKEAEIDLQRKLTLWTDLQMSVNILFDSAKARPGQDVGQGIRQIIEKKEGLFRKNMMGKRVNYAARSVISPDPYISTSQIGVPLRFARTLTYPQPVTPWNVEEMRQLVTNGAEEHPGANYVENEMGRLIDLRNRSPQQRLAISKMLLVRSASAQGFHQNRVKRVWRHLQTGDVVLMNRQPTLHKPSMMAHVARVLTNPKMQTIRMHYANCNTYNADFDGDEMNMHFPQNELARSEAYHIAANDYQYLVPTDGSPLRGLIQDHVVCGVKLTQRDTFLTRDMYMQLLYNAWASMEGMNLPGMQVDTKSSIELIVPAILKPRKFWTGKQVITSILKMLTRGLPQLNLDSKTKVKGDLYGAENAEHIVIFRDGELLQGVLDKSQFGASMHGFVHATYELYGARIAADLLTALGRLFTCYLQFVGHTCALEDLTLCPRAEKKRRKLIAQAEIAGEEAYAEFAGLEELLQRKHASELNGKKRRMNIEERTQLQNQIAAVYAGEDAEQNSKALDAHMMGCVHKFNSEIIKVCLPYGQTKPFPSNNFSMMVLTGAKGSLVNHSQISCGLGQQALEGRRVPILVSGRSLPSFEPFDPSPRAGGYITDRFLTGLRPQEYYHHCMAGREGLVDTAVKTSRSGYLQRCLVKHLEDLQIAYDHTVRDSEGNIVQFLYGEDGIDPLQSAVLSGKDEQFKFQVMNHYSIAHKYGIDASFFDRCKMDILEPRKLHKKVQSAKVLQSSETYAQLPEGLRVRCRRLKAGETTWKSGNIQRGWVEANILRLAQAATDGRDCLYDIQYLDTGLKGFNVPRTAQFQAQKTEHDKREAMSGRVEIISLILPDPVMQSLPLSDHIGLISEALQDSLVSYKARNPSNCLQIKKKRNKKSKCSANTEFDPTKMMSKHVIGPDAFQLLVWVSYLRSLCAPGEGVGVIAAQSIGEPSTQMTLNTFHLAGHGAANVTLGIPRLREIIMTASAKMSTPMMTIPLKKDVNVEQAQEVEQVLNQISLASLISNKRGGVTVIDELCKAGNEVFFERNYTIRLNLFRMKYIRKAFGIDSRTVYRAVGWQFVSKLLLIISRERKKSGASIAKFSDSQDNSEMDEAPSQQAQDDDDDDDEHDEEQGTLRLGSRNEIRGYDELDAGNDSADVPKREIALEDEAPVHLIDLPDSADKKSFDTKFNASELTLLEVPESVRQADCFVCCSVNRKAHYVELRLRFSPDSKTILMLPMVKKAAEKVLVRHSQGISRCYLIHQRLSKQQEEVPCIQTQGLNFQKVWEFDHILDVNNLMTNDIHQVLQTYGVEAAQACIAKQINEVFGVYGISVDPRHLSLLADYMTAQGGYMPLNRAGMVRKGSSFQQITFETSMKFMADAALNGLCDDLKSPSARIVLGLPPKLGTGSFSLLQPVEV